MMNDLDSAAFEIPQEWGNQIYLPIELSNGKQACLQNFLYTIAIIVNPNFDATGYQPEARYCYQTQGAALIALATWDGQGDPPGPWVKEKFSGRLGPGATD